MAKDFMGDSPLFLRACVLTFELDVRSKRIGNFSKVYAMRRNRGKWHEKYEWTSPSWIEFSI